MGMGITEERGGRGFGSRVFGLGQECGFVALEGLRCPCVLTQALLSPQPLLFFLSRQAPASVTCLLAGYPTPPTQL